MSRVIRDGWQPYATGCQSSSQQPLVAETVKMPKRKTSFNQEWEKEHRFGTKGRKDEFHFYCTLCRSDVDVSIKGKRAIDRHASSDKHRANNRSAAGASSLSVFFYECSSPQDDKNAAAELTKVYHAVKHHQSYRSVDCGTKVDREIYNDSAIAKGVTCGKTEAKALCENCLGALFCPETRGLH